MAVEGLEVSAGLAPKPNPVPDAAPKPPNAAGCFSSDLDSPGFPNGVVLAPNVKGIAELLTGVVG